MKKTLFRKTTSLLLTALLLVTLFSGCKEKTGESSSNGNAVEATGEGLDIAEPYAEPVTINIVLGYRNPEGVDAPEDLTPETTTAVKRFKEDLNIELNYTWIVNADQYDAKLGAELAAGNLPDIMLLSPNKFEDLYSQGGLLDISETYAKYTTSDIDNIVNFDEKLIDAGKRDGKIYGLPMSTYPGQVTSQTYYRMDVLKEAGVESYEDLPTTIAEFEALCDKLMTLDFGENRSVGDPILPGNKYYIDSGLADFSPVFHAYESWGKGWYDDGSGTLIYAGIQDSLKEPLTKLNEWYNKGYIAKDFAAQDVWAADAKVVADIVAGKYPIVFGSWWIPNWPLNESYKNNPDVDWVVGPTLTVDGAQPTILVPRYPVNNFVAISRDFEHPEALFKMMNWSINYAEKTGLPDFEKTATPEELLEKQSYVYNWIPYRTHSPITLVENYEFINEKREANITEIDPTEAPVNGEFWDAWNSYTKYSKGEIDGAVWGFYTSRIAPEGGVANMYDLYSNSKKFYDEVYITTPTMITKEGEMNKLKDTTILSMIMGETPISDFEKYVAEWKNQGGDEISAEVNEWFETQ